MIKKIGAALLCALAVGSSAMLTACNDRELQPRDEVLTLSAVYQDGTGEIAFAFENTDLNSASPRFEVSLDGGETWKNGEYELFYYTDNTECCGRLKSESIFDLYSVGDELSVTVRFAEDDYYLASAQSAVLGYTLKNKYSQNEDPYSEFYSTSAVVKPDMVLQDYAEGKYLLCMDDDKTFRLMNGAADADGAYKPSALGEGERIDFEYRFVKSELNDSYFVDRDFISYENARPDNDGWTDYNYSTGLTYDKYAEYIMEFPYGENNERVTKSFYILIRAKETSTTTRGFPQVIQPTIYDGPIEA